MSPLPPLFSALGDPTRLAIVERLMTEGELDAGTIQAALPISAPAVSRHLDVLKRAGLVTRRAEKQRRLYAVRPEALTTISQWTMSHREFWDTSLRRLELAIKKDQTP
ncbi:ArsR/SmtB family transcription factor [Frigidibacter sp. ROC022]|uniref:ArsR/SmtB family transcription factor n=1 Tax=Frigidibacter sp. ROC022 TaxID=2971796 RepID=UPI00215A13AB|nr:metalloregulator ArsR/SmtB family transcription factor [Frigidibacter sp. ROC022]MCR8726763.1 metalloregulator ArsR/SmtB family transcription factor [Frigidibacter sp. ROC022]